MVEDKDVRQSAASIVKIHGDTATRVCADMADRWAKRGDPEAAENWRRIMEATRNLTVVSDTAVT